MSKLHCVKCVRIRSYSGPHFSAFGLNTERYSVRMRENADQNNSEYGHFTQCKQRTWKLSRVDENTKYKRKWNLY